MIQNNDELSKVIKRNKKLDPYHAIYEDYRLDIEDYLKSKIPDTDICTIKEIATYCATRMWVPVQDVIFQRDSDWRREIDKMERRKNSRRNGSIPVEIEDY